MCNFERFAQNILLLFATILLLVIAGELAVRLFSDLSVPLVKRNRQFGMTFRENSIREIIGPESKQKVLIRINEEGFRTPSRPKIKQPGAVRIAIIGDSQIAAINTREEDTMAVLLEDQLNILQPQVHWEVFNFGVSGANTAQELTLYRELVRKYDMDVVVCAYYNGNDFSDNSIRLSRNPGIHMDFKHGSDELITLYPAPTRKTLSNWLNENSRLYVWQKYFIGDAINNLLASGVAGKNQKVRDEFLIFVDDPTDAALAYSWRINEKIIRDFNKDVTADNAFFIFLSIPHGIETTAWQWEEYLRMAAGTKYAAKIDRGYPEKKLEEIMARHQIDHLFLRSIFIQHLRKSNSNVPGRHLAYKEGLGHLNETGNLVMANALLYHLQNRGIITKLSKQNSGERQNKL